MGDGGGGREVLARSDTAMFLWGFAVIFGVVVPVMAGIYLIDGPPGQLHPVLEWLILGFFIVATVILIVHALGEARTRVEWDGAGLWLVRITPLSRSETLLEAADVQALEVLEQTDSDGDPYFRCVLRLRDGSATTVAEGHHREPVAEAEARLRDALGLRGDRVPAADPAPGARGFPR